MHCDSPTCAGVVPADAIKRTEDGIVQTARKPRCIACNNCVLAPFGVPEDEGQDEPHDEVRYVLRPDVGWAETMVRIRLSKPGAGVPALSRRDRAAAPARQWHVPLDLGCRPFRTKVNIMIRATPPLKLST